jgi:Rod binding domain-containing protein
MGDLAITAAGALNAHDPQARLRAAARGFETYFLAEMLKPLEQPMFPEDEQVLDGGSGGQTFRGMQHQALAEQAAGRLGVAAMIERAMKR